MKQNSNIKNRNLSPSKSSAKTLPKKVEKYPRLKLSNLANQILNIQLQIEIKVLLHALLQRLPIEPIGN